MLYAKTKVGQGKRCQPQPVNEFREVLTTGRLPDGISFPVGD